jgi:uracil-DNA glycosylase
VKDGLISLTELGAPTRAPVGRLPQCAACGLYRGCEAPRLRLSHPKMIEPAGAGRLKTLVVGEAPGETEDYNGKPFVGRAGRRLQEALARCGVALFDDCWVMNAAACRPVAYDRQLKRHENRPPTEKEIGYCRPAVFAALEELKPERIVLLGGGAMVSVLGRLWKPFGLKGAVYRWNGWQVPCQELNAWVCPTYHPSHVLREDGEALNRIFDGQLRAAFALKGRPFKKVPDYGKRIHVELDADRAADMVASMCFTERQFAVDYETTCLKPEGDGRILCVAVSDGSASLATPWRGKVPEVMKNILSNPKVKKIAANAKFEDKWTRAKLGTPVKGWLWDTMVAAHVLDNRRGVSGLKFQAFARLGQGEYDTHVDRYIAGEGGYGKNRLHDVDVRDLLFYCAMDSLLEYKLAQLQMKELGCET